jgi:cellulose synthase/poly-beta-1,6-N-acetylglucosamine synthase-like glycosyltransferase
VGLAGIAILNAFTYPRLKPGRPKQTPLVSIIVPARNEAQNIERVINNLLEQDYPNLEILLSFSLKSFLGKIEREKRLFGTLTRSGLS